MVTFKSGDPQIINGEKPDFKDFPLGWSSMSKTYSTREELFEDKGILEDCKVCGVSHFSTSFTSRDELVRNHWCFSCNYWMERVELASNPNSLRVDGVQYQFCPMSKGDSRSLGFGGRFFRIKTNDGRLLETNNLWLNGSIPEPFREMLPDNAVFVDVGRTEVEIQGQADALVKAVKP